MKIFQMILYLIAALTLSACSVTSDMHLPFTAKDNDTTTVAVKDGTNNEPVTGKHCRSHSTFPLFWRVNTDEALKKAFSKRRGIVALENVTVTQKIQFYLVFSNICTEIVGHPLYAQNEFD